MEKPLSIQELQDSFDKLIEKTKEELLQAKEAGKQYMNYKDFQHLCDTIKNTYCSLMEADNVPTCISEVCDHTLSFILHYRTMFTTSGLYPSLASIVEDCKKIIRSSAGISAEAEELLRTSLREALAQAYCTIKEK